MEDTVPLSRPNSRGQGAARSEVKGSPAVGEVINDRFRIEAALGRGGMSLVYRAFDSLRNTEVALKFLHPVFLGDPDAMRAFETEARVSMALNHPGILKVFDQQRHGDTTFLVMEVLSGGTLRQWMREHRDNQGRVAAKDACRILIALCEALSEAHRTTVHRDLKPENIGFTEDGELKVMDFGLAQLTRRRQSTRLREAVTKLKAGTPYYMAPEVISGEHFDLPASDQFSVGVIGYELLSGVLPVGLAPSLAERRPDLPPRLSRAIDRALAHHPQERFANMDAFGHAIHACATQTASPWHAFRHHLSCHRTALATAALSLLLVSVSLYSFGEWRERLAVRQERSEAAWRTLRQTQAELGILSELIKEKRQAYQFLQTTAEWRAKERTPSAPENDEHATRPLRETSMALATARGVWEWLTPQISESRDAFLHMDQGLMRAEAAVADADWNTFLSELREIEALKADLLTKTDTVETALEMAHRLEATQRDLEELSLTTAPHDHPPLAVNEEVLTRGVPRDGIDEEALSSLRRNLTENEQLLEHTFEEAMNGWTQAREAWITQFPKLGPPDLTFIAQPHMAPQQALKLKSSDAMAEAILTLRQAETVYRSWTEEVHAFQDRLQQAPPPQGKMIESLGMQFIEVNGVYWSRWEVRVMDVARFVTDNAPLSRDSLAFWGNSDFPLGPTAPMVGITRRDAKDFCVWLARKVSDSAPEPLYRQLHRKATPEGRLPTREDWEGLTLHEKLNAPFAYAIYPEAREWYTEHFRSEYADRDLDFLPFLQPVDQRALSPSGFFGLQDGVWEWSGSYYFYDGRRSTNAERQKWLLAGGGFTGKVAFNAIAPPDPDLAFVLRKETIGFRPVIDPRGK